MSTYGNMACPMLADGKCSRIFDENALVSIPNPTEGKDSKDEADVEKGNGKVGEEKSEEANPEEASAADEAAKKKAEEEAAEKQKADQEAMKQRITELSGYQWSEEAVPLKDAIYNLLLTLMEVDKKFTAFSLEMNADESERERLEEEMSNLKKSLEDINVKIDGKKPEVQAAHNYKEIIRAAKK